VLLQLKEKKKTSSSAQNTLPVNQKNTHNLRQEEYKKPQK